MIGMNLKILSINGVVFVGHHLIYLFVHMRVARKLSGSVNPNRSLFLPLSLNSLLAL